MLKKLSTLALAGLIALPAVANAGAGAAPKDLERKIDELSKQLDALKAQMAKQGENINAVDKKVGAVSNLLDEKSPAWDLASRVTIYGDFRSRFDYMNASAPAYYTAGQIARGMAMALPSMGMGPGPYSTDQIKMAVAGMKMYTPAMRAGMFQMMGITPVREADWDNDTMMTNRLRLNIRVNATDDVEFKGRLAMYKAWGMQSHPLAGANAHGNPYLLDTYGMDGASTREPNDNALLVDRAFVNWNNIGGMPLWFSVGRRPTSDGPPAQLRQGTDERMATPVNFMDYPFDGLSLGYAYKWGMEAMGNGRVRFCYGRGFEGGLTTDVYGYDRYGINDMDFAGLSWDVMQKGSRFFNIQSFLASNIVNTPDGVVFGNPLEMYGLVPGDGYLDRTTLGNIYHTSAVYMDKVQNLNYFMAVGWSRTDPSGWDEMGTSLMGSWWSPLETQDGYSIYAGIRYDIKPVKLGLEYNYGTKYWLSFTPGHDDLYNSKLATRGHVGEAYMIYDLPTGAAVSKFAKTFIRLGYQYYKYDYTGSGMWLGNPVDIDELKNDPLNAQFYSPVEDQSQIYLTFEAYF